MIEINICLHLLQNRICAIDGQFQGANNSDFSDRITLYTIGEKAEMTWEQINLNHVSRTFKYARYITATKGRNYIAKVEFMMVM